MRVHVEKHNHAYHTYIYKQKKKIKKIISTKKLFFYEHLIFHTILHYEIIIGLFLLKTKKETKFWLS